MAIEINDVLYNTALALEEMIVYHEGKMPARVLDYQRKNGFVEARRLVLNEARATLRRAKTMMLRAGILVDNQSPESRVANEEGGFYAQTLHSPQARTPVDPPFKPPLRPLTSDPSTERRAHGRQVRATIATSLIVGATWSAFLWQPVALTICVLVASVLIYRVMDRAGGES